MDFLKSTRNTKIFLLLSLLFKVINVDAHHIPSNPCPNLFHYKTDGSEIFGSYTLEYAEIGRSYTVDMKFTLLGVLPTPYYGDITLLMGRDRTLKNIELKRPIVYKVKFPVQDRIPRLTEIKVNNKLMCSGPKDSGSVTNIHLKHTLHTQSSTVTYLASAPQSNNKRVNSINLRPNINQINQQTTYDPNVIYMNDNDYYPIQTPNVVVKPNPPSLPIRKTTTPSLIRRPIQITSAPPPPPPPLLQDPAVTVNSVCGRENVKLKPLVVGGQVIKRGTWPWLVAIYLNDPKSLSFQCGGNLISTRTVLTAAHCFKYQGVRHNPNKIIIVAGRHNLLNWNDDGSITTGAQNIFIHPDYHDDLRSFDADVAVVLLKDVVIFTQYIKPICLWNEPDDLQRIEGSEGIVVGWGKDENGQDVSPEPKKVSATIVSETTCRNSDERFLKATSSRTFCAGKRDGEGPCSGDSGGGLMLWRNGRWVIRGTVSGLFGDALETTCKLKDYVIYSDIAKFIEWIHSTMVF